MRAKRLRRDSGGPFGGSDLVLQISRSLAGSEDLIQYFIRCFCLLGFGLVAGSFAAVPAFAGGGPENVFLVVNSRSGSSLAIANHYRQLRKIPDSNLLFLDWNRSVEAISIDTFRDHLLTPIFAAIDKRKLSGQIDYIVYSSDFPYAVNYGTEVRSIPPGKFTKGSLTGLTYLSPLVMAKTSYTGEKMNWYARTITPAGLQTTPTRGFRFESYWDRNGEVTGANGMRYILSAMLGYTSGRGNSVEEVIDYLDRSAQADSTHPTGTIYFSKNDDIRSKVRSSWFGLTSRELARLGVRAEVVEGAEGVVPRHRKDVMGATLGRATLPWATSGNEILPGALCENFTSFGGLMAEYGSQTPLTELLRHGAAGSTGTVVEPFAKPDKFPHPFVHVHYARGCSLAESVYQSVRGPYQLLLVGDPLCQPWAKPPTVRVAGLKANQTVNGIVSVRANVVGNVTAKHCEVFLEGRRVATVPPGQEYALDTTQIPEGYHELRVVAVADDLIESQGRQIIPFVSDNLAEREITFNVHPQKDRAWNAPFVIDASSPGAKGIAVYSSRKLIARSGGDKCRMVIKSSKLGLGPSQLQVIGLHDKKVEQNIFSTPVTVNVVPPKLIESLPPPVGIQYQPGLRLANVLASRVITDTSPRDWPAKSGIVPGEEFTLEGLVEVPRDGVYQLQVIVFGELQVSFGQRTVANMRNQKGGTNYALIPLKKGWHVMKAKAKLDTKLRCSIKFGGAGCRSIGTPAFHVPG